MLLEQLSHPTFQLPPGIFPDSRKDSDWQMGPPKFEAGRSKQKLELHTRGAVGRPGMRSAIAGRL